MDTTPSPKNSLFYIKRITGAVLLVALAATFFYSGYSKCGVKFQGFHLVSNDNAFDSFQWTFLDLGINNIFATAIIARMMIGLEFMLGLFLLFHIYLKRFTYPVIIVVLSVFIIYLLMVILKQGDSGNCGCFGDNIAMKPSSAIWKNLIMMAVTILLMFIYPIKPYKHQEYYSMLLGLIAFSTPFVVNSISTATSPTASGKPINLELLYNYTPQPSEELRKGKHIIMFASLTCPHCRKAAYLLQIIHHQHPALPIFMVLDGPDTFKKQFFDETHAESVPYLYYRHTAEFDTLVNAGYNPGETSGVPSIYLVNNGIIEYRSTYYQLDPAFMEKWIKKP
jgi:uncharacterized membrane protein YphA (DoxX/SURF4 family)